MKPQHWAMVLLVLFGASVAAVRILVEKGPRQPLNAESLADHKRPLEPLWAAPDFSYMSQRGQTVTRASLLGKPWVADFIFTQCRTVCPLLTAKMVQLQRKLSGADVRFISFSVDPEHDTPEALEQYAMHWAPDEARWSLLSTDAQSLPKLAKAFRVTAQKNDDAQAIDPIIHSSVFVLIDAEGQVRGVYDSERRDSFQSLAQDALKLVATPTAPQAARAPRDGQTLYRELSCGACHDRPELAPALGGLLGRNRELDNASIIVADEAYLRESILQPEAKRVRPYTLKMPAYDSLLGEPELTTLVKYVAALPANAAPADVHEEEDPVCHMRITVAPDSPSAGFQGKTVHFCSQACRDRFVKAPETFTK